MLPAALTGTSWWPSSLHREIPRRRQNGSTSSCRWYPPSRHTTHSGLSRSSPHHSHLEEMRKMLRKMFKWTIYKKLPCLWASSVLNLCSCDDMHHFCAYICQETATFLQKGAVLFYQRTFGPGAASACHTNILVTVTSSVFADQYFLPIFDLTEE